MSRASLHRPGVSEGEARHDTCQTKHFREGALPLSPGPSKGAHCTPWVGCPSELSQRPSDHGKARSSYWKAFPATVKASTTNGNHTSVGPPQRHGGLLHERGGAKDSDGTSVARTPLSRQTVVRLGASPAPLCCCPALAQPSAHLATKPSPCRGTPPTLLARPASR